MPSPTAESPSRPPTPTMEGVSFHDDDLLETLNGLTDEELDRLPFGLVRLDPSNRVTLYNQFEAEMAGLDAAVTQGKVFFESIAPCCNNFMVAERYQEEGSLDAQVDYVFTYKLQPTRVVIRMLKPADDSIRYFVVHLVGPVVKKQK